MNSNHSYSFYVLADLRRDNEIDLTSHKNLAKFQYIYMGDTLIFQIGKNFGSHFDFFPVFSHK